MEISEKMFSITQEKQEQEKARKTRRGKENIKNPWVREAIYYWSSRVPESDLGVDWVDAHIYCWRCGTASGFQRCHIVPRSLGGTDGPENTICLCPRCHDQAPDVADPEFMWKWVKETHAEIYDLFWHLRAVKEAVAFGADLSEIDWDKYSQNIKKVSPHLGQGMGGQWVADSSIAWALLKACD